ncbi:MAG: type II secretion system ATPase GspE [Gammaproteobacteria bacterium]
MKLPFTYARRNGVLVEDGADGTLAVTLSAAAQPRALIELRRVAGCRLAVTRVPDHEFTARLQQTYEDGQTRAEQTMADLGDALDLEQLAAELNEPTDLLEAADDAPIIRLLNALFAEAIREHASDIHIESFEGRLGIRLRVDGVLREVMRPPFAIAPLLVSRIKIMAKLDIAEKRLPQDGRISLRVANRPVDVRVSTMPAGHGERVVLRLLDKRAGRLELEQLGMDAATTARIDAIIHQPHGIFLVTGPTGSGKTTTLYAALSRLNDSSRNVMTVEDPIEYFIDGIAQTQVNTRVDMSFARGLRAILRQDPDVVMVGEIRDLETAQIAIQASLTGHMVFSTLHTNSAIGAVTRLRDMGTEPFLLASSLTGVLAQRLVRVLCPACKRPRAVESHDHRVLGEVGDEVVLFEAVGCAACNGIGYRGRTAIYELFALDAAARTLVHDGASEQVLEQHARTSSQAMHGNGCARVLAGETTVGELLRVTQAV